MLMLAGTALCGCSGNEVAVPAEDKPVLFTGTIKPFEGEDSQSRVNVEGTGFIVGDFIRIKVICPYVTSSEYGEQTYGASYDSFWLLKSNGGSWGPLTASDGCDINGDYLDSGSQPMSSLYLSQQTPYVFTAQTWSVERKFVAGSNLVLLYSPIFHADQSREENYRASDLLWAQSYLQTGSESVHFDFYHKMAALKITIDDSALPEGKKLSDNAILSLSGMPGIDHAEVVVGDYYAAKSKTDVAFGYKQKNSCTKENNGKVLGVAVNTATNAYTLPMRGNPDWTPQFVVPNNGTYTAYKAATKPYRLIVPPCVLKNEPVFHLLDGDRRWTYKLNKLTFEQENLYKIKINVVPDSPSISTE